MGSMAFLSQAVKPAPNWHSEWGQQMVPTLSRYGTQAMALPHSLSGCSLLVSSSTMTSHFCFLIAAAPHGRRGSSEGKQMTMQIKSGFLSSQRPVRALSALRERTKNKGSLNSSFLPVPSFDAKYVSFK